MAEEPRSPFGELVYTHRRRLRLTRDQLEYMTHELKHVADDEAKKGTDPVPRMVSISARTLWTYERVSDDPAHWVSPRPSAVRTLIAAFALEPGSPEYAAFIEAADASTGASGERSVASTAPAEPKRVFVAAGREPHLARLRQAVDDTVAGEPGVVVVTAEAGMGKTWLIEEACREAVEQHPGLVTVLASCTRRFGTMDAHQPLRQLLGIMVGDIQVVSQRQRVSDLNSARLIDRIPDAISAIATCGRGVMHRLLSAEALRNPNLAAIDDDTVRRNVETLIEAAPAPAQVPSETWEQLFQVLARYASAGPVVLVLDDLHWADTSTLAALSHLLSELRQQRLPLLVIGSVRLRETTAVGQRPRLQSVLRLARRQFPDAILDLSTATDADAGRAFVDEMIARAGHDVSRDTAETLFRKTAGLPLFVAGILRRHERDGDPDDNDNWAGRIPTEMRLMFAEQVNNFPAELQRVLLAASVQGDTFSAEILMEVLDLSRADFIEMIDMSLVQQERLLLPAGKITIAGHVVHYYQFFHGLLRDYIYHDMMTEHERTLAHTATAEALTERFGPTDHYATDAIAVHHDRAGDRNRAAVAWLHAGDHMSSLREFDRAVAHYERIGQLRIRRSDPPTFIQSLIGLGNCARSQGNPAGARRKLARAQELARQQGLPFIEGLAMEALAMVDFDAGEMQAGVDRLTAVIELWLAADRDDAGRAMANLSYLLYGLGRYDESMTFAERGVAMATRLGDDRMWIDATIGMANCQLDLGLYDEAVATYTQCIGRCDGIVDHHRAHICWFNISLAQIERRRWDDAHAIIERELSGAQGLGAHLTSAAELILALIAEGRGDLQAAQEHFAVSRDIRERTGQQALLVDSLAGLLRVATARGEHARMGPLRDDIQTRVDERGMDGIEHIGKLFIALIEASQALGDPAAARVHAQQATTILGNRAEALSNPAHRESYLKVPARRRVFELAEALAGDAGTS